MSQAEASGRVQEATWRVQRPAWPDGLVVTVPKETVGRLSRQNYFEATNQGSLTLSRAERRG